MNVVWQPQPRQAAFMERPEWEALYGGAAGGGKSDALVIEALRQVHIPHYKALILRKTFPQLAELIDKSLNYYPRAFPGARYNATAHTWTFPSGAKIIFGAMQYAKDKTKYQAVFDVVRKDGSTELLPSVMQSYVKDGNGEKHELSAVEYVEFQTDYNRLYWEYVEGNLEEAGTDAERRAVLRAAKELAAEQAKRRALSRLGLEPEDYEHKGKNGKESVTVPYKYEGISEDEIITFEAQKALASSDGSFSQDEAIDIIQEMVDSGLSKEAAYTLFHAANSSWTDKNNPWKRYKP